jgi:anti-sigma-K factor RskA
MLVVRADEAGGLHIHALQNLATRAGGKSLELWAIPPGQAPQSVGLVSPEGLTALRRAQGLAGVQQLAITLEPPGGSPTGAPTGPVIMSGDVLKI